jgi:integrase
MGSFSTRKRGKGWSYIIRHESLSKPEWSRQQPTKGDAERLAVARLVQLDQGLGIGGSKETVGVYMHNWLAGRKSIRASTRVVYRTVIEQQITPYLGDIPIAKLRSDQIAAWHGKMLADGKSQRAVNYAQVVLTAGLRQAVKWGYIPRDPSALVERGVVASKDEVRWWEPEEVQTFLAATTEHQDAALYRLALSSCLRYSELTALRWEDVDLKRQRVLVRRTWSRSGVRGMPWMIEAPKDHEQRIVPIDDETVAVLVRHKERQVFARARSDRWEEHDLIFPGRDGGMISAEMVRRRFRQAVTDAGVSSLHFHGLRHSGAMLLLRAGVSLKVVSDILGHSNISFTARTYLHTSESMQDEAAQAMGRMLGG